MGFIYIYVRLTDKYRSRQTLYWSDLEEPYQYLIGMLMI